MFRKKSPQTHKFVVIFEFPVGEEPLTLVSHEGRQYPLVDQELSLKFTDKVMDSIEGLVDAFGFVGLQHIQVDEVFELHPTNVEDE